MLSASGSDTRAFVLIDDGVVGRFGAALAWAVRAGASSLDVLVDGPPPAAGLIARRAGAFSLPCTVWAVDGRSVAAASPAPVVGPSSEPPPPDLVSLLQSHGLEVVWEHGVLRGEVLGLEVARTVGGSLEVGVGRHDRMARFEMRPSESLSSALAETSSAVRSRRRPGALAHPANRLARSRWLRAVVVSSPGAVGLAGDVLAVPPPLPWFDLPEAGPAPCVGESASSGSPGVAGCSVGVDLDLVPTAADCRLMYGSDGGGGGGGGGVGVGGGGGGVGVGGGGGGVASEVWLIVPAGDDIPIQHELASLLDPPARVVTVARGWEAALATA